MVSFQCTPLPLQWSLPPRINTVSYTVGWLLWLIEYWGCETSYTVLKDTSASYFVLDCSFQKKLTTISWEHSNSLLYRPACACQQPALANHAGELLCKPVLQSPALYWHRTLDLVRESLPQDGDAQTSHWYHPSSRPNGSYLKMLLIVEKTKESEHSFGSQI